VTQKLLGKQVEGKAAKPIQDVTTRWWSTYSMCDCLLIALLENEGDLTCNLTDLQWLVVTDLDILLKPFMIAQKLLEGEAYVTISLVPYMVYKIRKGLLQAAENLHSSDYISCIATEMLQAYNKHFGEGEDGTVATENFELGSRRRPKGINMLALMASFLDPRMKGGVGITEADINAIYENIRSAIEIAAVEVAGQGNQAHQQIVEQGTAPPVLIQPLPADELDMFDEIYHHYLMKMRIGLLLL
jgi:hypothetical protein